MLSKENSDIIVVGFVGHIPIDDLASLKKQIETISNFKIIFFKTSSGKLWIKEGTNE